MGKRNMGTALKDTPIREEWVDNPHVTWSQFLHDLDAGIANAGRHRALVDRRTILGGFHRFHGTEAQEKAAARFKSIYERSQVGGAKAVDPSKEPVDGGGINPESVIEMGADARRAYNAMHLKFGRQFMMHVEFVVMGDHGPTTYARWASRNAPKNGALVGRYAADFRRMMDQLAEHMGYQSRNLNRT